MSTLCSGRGDIRTFTSGYVGNGKCRDAGPFLPIYSGEFFKNMRNFSGQNMRNLAKYGTAYVQHTFSHISGMYNIEWWRIMIIIRPILHSFDIFDLICLCSTSNCKYTSNCLPPKISNSLKTTFNKENAEKLDHICGIYANICELLHMQHNFCIMQFWKSHAENMRYAGFGKVCDCIFAYNWHS